MRKVWFYSALFTLFMWLGGILPVAHSQHEPGHADTGAVADRAHQDAVSSTQGAATAHDDHAEAGGDHAKVGLLDPQFGPLLWQLILFLLLIAVLGKFVWPPILKGLQLRDEKIRGDLESAERANRDAQATLQQYKTQLAEAQREAQRIIDQSKTDAQRVAGQLKEQAEVELKSMRDRAQADINTAKEQAIAEVYEQTANLATQVAAQILRREVRPEDHQALVQRSLSGLETAQR